MILVVNVEKNDCKSWWMVISFISTRLRVETTHTFSLSLFFFFLEFQLMVSLVETQSNKHFIEWTIQMAKPFFDYIRTVCNCLLAVAAAAARTIHWITELQAPKVPIQYTIVYVVFFERWTQALAMTVWLVWKFISRFQQKCYRWCKTKFSMWNPGRLLKIHRTKSIHTKPYHIPNSIAVTLLFKRMV